jgi:hypothetical protein
MYDVRCTLQQDPVALGWKMEDWSYCADSEYDSEAVLNAIAVKQTRNALCNERAAHCKRTQRAAVNERQGKRKK